MTKCDAKTRSGGRCQQVAGWGTDHVGQGRCKLHGGATPIKHGRYSAVERDSLRGLIAAYEADPDPLCVLPEIAAARALFVDFINRYAEWREALLAWHATFDRRDNPKPREILDVSDAYRLLKSVAQIAQAEKRLQLEGAVSRKDLLRVLGEMQRTMQAEVHDEHQRQRIIDGWSRIQLA